VIPIFEPDLSEKEEKYVARAVETGWISSQGEFIDRFERDFAARFGRAHGVATSNCTTALHLSLVALGIGDGDEVICPNLTFIAPANMISLVGASPVLVDVAEETWNVDPLLVEQSITKRTKAIIVVHGFGHAAPMDELNEIAKNGNIQIIEDNAESVGAAYKGRLLGSLGKLSCFSFYANKILTTGEGGMILTDDEDLYHGLRELRDHGMSRHRRYAHVALGFNYRMTNMQAALGVAQLERLNEILKRRNEQERLYEQFLSSSNQLSFRPKQSWAETVHWMMTIRLHKEGVRDQMLNFLKSCGIDCRQMIFPVNHAIHFQEAYLAKSFPVSDRISLNSLHLPSSTRLSTEQISWISEKVLIGLERYG
jgi:perosamine synthetase